MKNNKPTLPGNPAAWVCAQIGAREHYAIPRALLSARRTVRLCTDFWAGPLTRKLAIGRLRPLAARHHSGLLKPVAASVCSWNLSALLWERQLRRAARSRTPYHGFIEVGRRFAQNVQKDLERRARKEKFIFFAYDTGALEALAWCRKQGVHCVLDQMDPGRVEVELVQAEEKAWPGWAQRSTIVPEEYFSRRELEWSLADRIVVNSRWSADALTRQGVPAAKLSVVPLSYEAPQAAATVRRKEKDEPLRVLFLGQVILRKGIQYLMAAARQLGRERLRVDVVGPVGISREAVAGAPANVVFHGRTARDTAATWYEQAHVFVLPTLSDGFALTQLEAMSAGLPVIATGHCGEVVRDNVDGFVIPSREAAALAEALTRYLASPELLSAHSAAARSRAREFGLSRLSARLLEIESQLAQ